MKIGIIGANGHVGTELCFILKKDDVIPIVRNKMGSLFLQHNGLHCRIADIFSDDDAKNNLHDLDVIVISSFAADRLTGSQNQTSKLINEKLIKNAMKFSKSNSTIIYLSTIRAFAHKIDPQTSRFLVPRYDREKQLMEKTLMSESKKWKKRGFALRLGMVFGEHQVFTNQIKEKLSSNKKITVNVSANNKSNIVHTVTIADAILVCAKPEVKSGIYSLVNEPQWTWKDVYDYYNKDTQLEFTPQISKSIGIFDFFWKRFKSNKKLMIPILYHIPSRFEGKIQRLMNIKKYQLEISQLKNDKIIDDGNGSFPYHAMPGPFLPGLQKTIKLLQNYSSKIFNTE